MISYLCISKIINRQPTPFDRICYRVVDKEQGPLGSRVFGDCDRLMKEVIMKLVEREEIKIWEDEQDIRNEQYAKQRRP